MPKNIDSKSVPEMPGSNPSVNPKTGAINPSAPTVGTEGWGTTSDERRVLQQDEAADTRAGQMKGNPGDDKAGGAQRQPQRAAAGKGSEEADKADLSRRTSASAHSMNTSQGGSACTFRCTDAGNADCRFETSADIEDEVMRNVEQHWREGHGMGDWTQAMRDRVRDSIRHRQAA